VTGRGEVNVSGAGSVWNNGRMYIGDDGIGIMTISGGAVVNGSYSSYLGSGADSSATLTVTGPGLLWFVDGDVDVGGDYDGLATVNISQGSKFTVEGEGYIGYSVDGQGFVNVSGAGSLQGHSISVGYVTLLVINRAR
jgi:T5SS/PEP-CTERM-associated repeat protein